MNLGGVIHLNKSGIYLIVITLSILLIYLLTSNYHNYLQNSVSLEETTGKINLKHLLEVSLRAAENGGIQVVASKDNLNIKSKGLTKEGAEDSVTTADFRSHCSMKQTLTRSYPNLNVISEEAKTDCTDEKQLLSSTGSNIASISLDYLADEWVDVDDVTVWIDPLDATHEYTEHLYQYVTTMVCTAVNGKPLLGVIHQPFDKITYWAWVGKAASTQLNLQHPNYPETMKIIVSRSHSGEIKKLVDEKFSEYQMVVAAGAGYKAVQVATGQVDAYLHVTAIKKWDICAGNAIINAVGGQMTTKSGKIIDYRDIGNVVNEDGLVVTLKDHNKFVEL